MEKLQTSFGSFNVYINRLDESEEDIFHISFIDKNNKAHIVLMQKFMDGWRFIDDASIPGWIISLEPQFQELITKEIVGECEVLLKAAG